MKWICKCGNDDRDGGRVDSKGVFTCKECLDKKRTEFTDKEKEMLRVLLTDENGKIIRP